MGYTAYANSQEICDKLCCHSVGDIVKLSAAVKGKYGIFEVGTAMVIKEIMLNECDAFIPEIRKDELNEYEADNGVFAYRLGYTDENVQDEVTVAARLIGEKMRSLNRPNYIPFTVVPLLLAFLLFIMSSICIELVFAAIFLIIADAGFIIYLIVESRPQIRKKHTKRIKVESKQKLLGDYFSNLKK